MTTTKNHQITCDHITADTFRQNHAISVICFASKEGDKIFSEQQRLTQRNNAEGAPVAAPGI